MFGNKRGRVRANFKTTIHLRFEDKTLENCISENISVNGVLVKSSEKVLIDDMCEINIILKNGDKTKIDVKVYGKINRLTDNGFAVNFLQMEHDSLIHLKNIVKYNTKNIERFVDECHKKPGFK